jgi:proteasome lid subunit RPN8/RPN11
VLIIDQATYDAILAHARRDHPDEACGVVTGPEGSGRAERFVPVPNSAMSPTYYEFSSEDLLKVHKDLWERDEEIVVTYHSHTATEAYPSRTDIARAEEPNSHYVIVSTRDGAEQQSYDGPVEFRSYRIIDGVVTEEEVKIVAAYADSDYKELGDN